MIGLDEAVSIHDQLLKASGGTSGLRDQGGLEAALNRPFMTFGGADLYPGPVDKAAAIMESIIKNHPFMDGNKRTGYALGRLMLNTQSLDFRGSDDEEYDLVHAIAMGALDVSGIKDWISARLVPF